MPARRRNRGTTTQRGYDWAHQQERRRLEPAVATGTVRCARHPLGQCLMPSPLILPGQPWHLGHTDDRSGWTGPEHARCNLADGGRRRHRPTKQRQALPQW